MQSFPHNVTPVFFIFALAAMIPLTPSSEQGGAGLPTAKINSNPPVLVVQTFTIASGVDWPYVPRKVQAQLVATLRATDGKLFDVVSTAPTGDRRVYLLQGEIVAYHAGAKKLNVFGSRRDHAIVHYCVIGPNGRKVFQHQDTIRQPYDRYMVYSDADNYKFLAGELGRPLADKIASRLKNSNLP